jgi:GntR family transcriptional regulator, transcriptional repressor for pyruvate dehydrogenase complex
MSTFGDLEPISRERVANTAIDRIKGLILSGAFGPHDRLPPERELAERLGVSRPTLREAMRALIAMNILESRHGDGTYVSSLDPRELAEPIDFLLRVDDKSLLTLFETRQVLEVGLARFAGLRAREEDIAEMRELMERYRAGIADYELCVQIDAAFHACVARAAGSPILESLLASVARLGVESRRRTGRSRAIRDATLADHGTIIAAIEARDAEGAAQAMHDHLRHIQTAIGGSEDDA